MSTEEGNEPFDPNKAGRVYPIVFTAGLAAACGLFLAGLALGTDTLVQENKKAKRNRCVLFSFGPVVKTFADTVNTATANLDDANVEFGWKHCYDSKYQPDTELLSALYAKYVTRVGFYELEAADLDEARRTGDYPVPYIESVAIGDTTAVWMMVETRQIGGQKVNTWCELREGDQKEAPFFEYYVCKAADGSVAGYSVGVGGPGFWEPIFAFLALEPDLFTIIGLSIYIEKDTPGLGGKCDEPPFLYQFQGREVVEKLPNGDYKFAPLTDGEATRTIASENTGRADFYVSKSGITDQNQVAAITGASETSTALQAIVNTNLNEKLPLLRAVLEFQNPDNG